MGGQVCEGPGSGDWVGGGGPGTRGSGSWGTKVRVVKEVPGGGSPM